MTPEDFIKDLIIENSKELYKDLLAPSMRQIGKLGEDAIKALRYMLPAIQDKAALQDAKDAARAHQLIVFAEHVSSHVPSHRLQAPPRHFAGYILDRARYLEPNNYLFELFANLLSRAMDNERVNEAHPAFANIIELLAPDEVIILNTIKTEGRYILDEAEFVSADSAESIPYPTKHNTLNFPQNIAVYCSHLQSLNLIVPENVRETALKEVQGPNGSIDWQNKNMKLGVLKPSEFGELFLRACLGE